MKLFADQEEQKKLQPCEEEAEKYLKELMRMNNEINHETNFSI